MKHLNNSLNPSINTKQTQLIKSNHGTLHYKQSHLTNNKVTNRKHQKHNGCILLRNGSQDLHLMWAAASATHHLHTTQVGWVPTAVMKGTTEDELN